MAGPDAVIIASSHKEFTNIGPSEYKTHRVKIVIDGENIYKLKKDIFEDIRCYLFRDRYLVLW